MVAPPVTASHPMEVKSKRSRSTHKLIWFSSAQLLHEWMETPIKKVAFGNLSCLRKQSYMDCHQPGVILRLMTRGGGAVGDLPPTLIVPLFFFGLKCGYFFGPQN